MLFRGASRSWRRGRQCHEQMEEIGQHNHRIYLKGVARFHASESVAQNVNFIDECARSPLRQIDGNEVSGSRNV